MNLAALHERLPLLDAFLSSGRVDMKMPVHAAVWYRSVLLENAAVVRCFIHHDVVDVNHVDARVADTPPLLMIVGAGDVPNLEIANAILTQPDADPNVCWESQLTCLKYIATRADNFESNKAILEMLLEHALTDVNDVRPVRLPYGTNSPLVLGIIAQNEGFVKRLLERSDVELDTVREDGGNAALYHAAANVNILQMLVQAGCEEGS